MIIAFLYLPAKLRLVSRRLVRQTRQPLAPANHLEPSEDYYGNHMETTECANTKTVERPGLPNFLASLPLRENSIQSK